MMERSLECTLYGCRDNREYKEQTANSLMAHHIPFNLLCVSHTCEVFDKGNKHVLCKIEMKIGLKEDLTFLC